MTRVCTRGKGSATLIIWNFRLPANWLGFVLGGLVEILLFHDALDRPENEFSEHFSADAEHFWDTPPSTKIF